MRWNVEHWNTKHNQANNYFVKMYAFFKHLSRQFFSIFQIDLKKEEIAPLKVSVAVKKLIS